MDQPPFVPLFAGAQQPGFIPLFGALSTAKGFTALSRPSAPEPPAQPLAEDALAAARAEAERLVTETRTRLAAEAEALKDAVRAEQVQAFREASQDLLQQLREQAEARLREIERESARIIVSVVERVLHERFEADEDAIVPVVREALQAVGTAGRAVVVVAPRHEPALRAAHHELLQVLAEEAHLEVVAAEGAEPFGCVVHADDHGSVGARLGDRLAALQRAVDETLASAEAA